MVGGTDDDIKKQGEPAQAAFPVLFVVLPAYLEKFLHLLPEPCRMGRRKRRSGKGMGGGGESRAEEEKKKTRSVQHFTEASAGCLNINLKASINNGVRHAANWGPSEPTLVSGPSVASPCSIPDWSLDRRGRHLTGVYWLVLDTVRSFLP